MVMDSYGDEKLANLYYKYAKNETRKWSKVKKIRFSGNSEVIWVSSELKHGWYSPERAQKHYDALRTHKKSVLTEFMDRLGRAQRKSAGFYLGIFHFNYSLYNKWLKVCKLGTKTMKKLYGVGAPKAVNLREVKDALYTLMQPGFFANRYGIFVD